jgi:hypothetical protein
LLEATRPFRAASTSSHESLNRVRAQAISRRSLILASACAAGHTPPSGPQLFPLSLLSKFHRAKTEFLLPGAMPQSFPLLFVATGHYRYPSAQYLDRYQYPAKLLGSTATASAGPIPSSVLTVWARAVIVLSLRVRAPLRALY